LYCTYVDDSDNYDDESLADELTRALSREILGSQLKLKQKMKAVNSWRKQQIIREHNRTEAEESTKRVTVEAMALADASTKRITAAEGASDK
jgi:hypothetical protein